jgi:signal transduction histidine kinase
VLEGYLEAFEDGLVNNSKKREQYLHIMHEKTGLLSYRISHLVELAKMTTMEWRQTLIATDLGHFLEESFGHISDEVNADGGTLIVDLKTEPSLIVSINHDMVIRVFENLIDNARNYSPRGSPISVSAWNTSSDAFISISNSGSGIPPEQVPLVFEPFFRGDPGRNTNGFGLGLASVKTIVDTHGWFISLESKPDVLTCFTIRIPLHNTVQAS